MKCFACITGYENTTKIPDAEYLGIAAIVKFGLISLEFSITDRLYEKSVHICFSCWLRRVESYLDGNVCINSVTHAGVSLLSRLKGPSKWRFERSHISSQSHITLPYGPSACIPKQITLIQVSHLSAFLDNAQQLGLSFYELTNDDSVSPFVISSPSSFR